MMARAFSKSFSSFLHALQFAPITREVLVAMGKKDTLAPFLGEVTDVFFLNSESLERRRNQLPVCWLFRQ